jgi:WD40 repeat protein
VKTLLAIKNIYFGKIYLAKVFNMELNGSLIGHKFRCFDVRFCSNNLVLTASEDGTAKLWKLDTKKCLFTFQHNKDCEVLRAIFLGSGGNKVVTCGADGKAIIWIRKVTSQANKWRYEQACTLDHGDTQIYACEAVPSSSSTAAPSSVKTGSAAAPISTKEESSMSEPEYIGLLTAADDRIYFWDLSEGGSALPHTWTFRNAASGHGDLEDLELQVGVKGDDSGGSPSRTYGGERNKEDAAYIFDAKLCPTDPHKVAIALSDGTVRLVDISNIENPSAKRDTTTALDVGGLILSLNRQAKKAKLGSDSDKKLQEIQKEDKDTVVHATCVSWVPGTTGTSLVVALGDGGILLLDLHESTGEYHARALLCGHQKGCFGVMCLSISDKDDDDSEYDSSSKETKNSPVKKRKSVNGRGGIRALSWSSDCTVCEWDLVNSSGIVTEPLQRLQVENFPLYCCSPSSISLGSRDDSLVFAGAGGAGGNGGFIGIPVHLASYRPGQL